MTESDMRQHSALLRVLLREGRLGKGVTTHEVADRLGVAESVVADWESGAREMDMEKLALYCRAIELPLHEFLWSLERAILETLTPMWADLFR